MIFVVDRQWFVISFAFIKEIQILKQFKIYILDIEVMAKAKNHTDNIDALSILWHSAISAFVKQFMSDCHIFVVESYVWQS